MTADYAPLLRRDTGQTVEVGKHWLTALTAIRDVIGSDDLSPEQKVDEAAAVLEALSAVQAELDAREA